MTAPETRAVVAALTDRGADVRFVGGCVRDAVLKRSIKDIDIATPDPPATVIALLEAAGIKVVPTGLAHGTVTAMIGEAKFEITTLRLDLATDGRRAKVAFTDNWIADAARRDFTFNALSCTPVGDIYDPFDGLADLGEGVVRFVGIPRERIEEDYLRLLRFFRMYATYGQPPPEAEALAACRQLAPGIAKLSGERVRDELFRILLAPNAADTAVLMHDAHVLEHVVPPPTDIGRLRMMTWLDSTALKLESVSPDALRRLAALLRADADGITALAGRLRLSRREAARVTALVRPAFELTPEADASALHRAVYHCGNETARDWVLMAWAGELALAPRRGGGRNAAWTAMLETASGWPAPAFPLRGADAAALGVAPGPRLGELLKAVETWWEAGDFTADRDTCLAHLRELAG
jgi:poly(A) polymerase